MDLKRIASGIVILLSVIIMLLIPNEYIVGILLTVITVLAMDEYLNAISKICKPVKWVEYLSCTLVGIINFVPKEYFANTIMIIMPVMLLLLFFQIIITDMKTTFRDIAYTFLGIGYISIFMSFLSKMNGIENGKIFIIYILIASWISDVFAYAIGKRIGKHKFSKVSPNKSIEGCVVGIISSIIFTLILTFVLNYYFGFEFSYIKLTIISIVLNIIGQIGDFAASSIKRYVDIKDYSDLLPGHGGMLDRIDSVLFIAPFAYILFMI